MSSAKLSENQLIDKVVLKLFSNVFLTFDFKQEHPRNLIPELLRLFYSLDWVNLKNKLN